VYERIRRASTQRRPPRIALVPNFSTRPTCGQRPDHYPHASLPPRRPKITGGWSRSRQDRPVGGSAREAKAGVTPFARPSAARLHVSECAERLPVERLVQLSLLVDAQGDGRAASLRGAASEAAGTSLITSGLVRASRSRVELEVRRPPWPLAGTRHLPRHGMDYGRVGLQCRGQPLRSTRPLRQLLRKEPERRSRPLPLRDGAASTIPRGGE
jgi:hypothetical protein